MNAELGRRGMPFAFLDAIDGRSLAPLPHEYNSAARKLRYGYDLSAGEIGCFLSHRKAWEECLNSGVTSLIFEDDVVLGDTFLSALELVQALRLPFDFIRLSGLTNRERSRIPVYGKLGLQVVEELNDPGGSGAYFLTPKGAEKLLEFSTPFHDPVDNFLESRWIHGLVSYAIVPYPVVQNVIASSIEDRIGSEKKLGERLRRLFFRSANDLRRFAWAAKRRVQAYSNKGYRRGGQ